jgi:predicted RNA methylase
MMRHGWFVIPGMQTGDRTLEEQIIAVRPALAEAKGRTVLDMGCAEGLIGLEFARAGALAVHGMDAVRGHIDVAEEVGQGQPMTFECADLNVLGAPRPYDIVLALGVIHKLHEPGVGLKWAADCTRRLLLVRSGRGERDGRIYSKHRRKNSCDRDEVLRGAGLVYEKTVQGPEGRGEDVQYWRRPE